MPAWARRGGRLPLLGKAPHARSPPPQPPALPSPPPRTVDPGARLSVPAASLLPALALPSLPRPSPLSRPPGSPRTCPRPLPAHPMSSCFFSKAAAPARPASRTAARTPRAASRRAAGGQGRGRSRGRASRLPTPTYPRRAAPRRAAARWVSRAGGWAVRPRPRPQGWPQVAPDRTWTDPGDRWRLGLFF